MRSKFVALSSVAMSIAYFVIAAPAGLAAPSRSATAASPGSAADHDGGTYVPVTPARILDTRIGVGAPKAPVASGATVNVSVGGAGGVPSTGVSAAVVNLTVTQPVDGGYVTAYPAGVSRPVVSDVSFPAATTRAHLVVAKLGAAGQVSLYNGSDGTVQLIVDVSGYYTAGTASASGAFTPVAPARLVDTRMGLGAPLGPVLPRASTVVTVEGAGGVPNSGVSAVVLNVTVAAPTGSGYEAVKYGTTPSLVNYQTGSTASNLAVAQVKPGAAGQVTAGGYVTLYNAANGNTDADGSIQLIVDVLGYYTAGAPQDAGLFGPDGPRILSDTRGDEAPIPAHQTLTFPVAGLVGIPADATAVALNVTVPGGPASGYLSVYAAGTARPVASTVNFQTRSIANLAFTGLSANGAVTVYNGSAQPANVQLDVVGFVGAVPGPLAWGSPQRIDTNATTSISCPSATFCMAVDDEGEETTYNGSTWSAQVSTGTNLDIDSVSCVSSTFCVAVDDGTSSQIWRNGAWTAVPVPGTDSYSRRVSCVSTTFCMAVDFAGDAYAFNGTTWGAPSQLTGGGSQLTVSCVSALFCKAVDDLSSSVEVAAGPARAFAAPSQVANTPIFTWDGTEWSAPTTVNVPNLESVNCLSTNFCLAASPLASIVYDGAQWSAPRPTPPREFQLTTACLSSSLCLGFDTYGAFSTYTSTSGWNATTALNSFGSFVSVACPTSTFCAALDNRGNVVIGG